MKKILLAITVCEQNKERIANQIAMLNKYSSYLQEFNIEPIFVYVNPKITVSTEPYKSWKVDMQESCTNLYLKIFALFEKACLEPFDYLIKIDDDTIFNINLFGKLSLDADYIGRIQELYTENFIHVDLPMYNIKKSIQLYPQLFK